MNKVIRIALGSAVLAAGLAVAGAAPAAAQVRFEGSFPLPSGRISIGVGEPAFSVGAFVPQGYSVYDDPDYGYGFYDGDRWIACEQSGSRWIVVDGSSRFAFRESAPYRSYSRFGRVEGGRGFSRERFESRGVREDRSTQGNDDRRVRNNDNRRDVRSNDRGDRGFRH